MKLERLQQYKNEMAGVASDQWGEILFRLVSEARESSKDWRDRNTDALKRELETVKLKLSIALGALDVYSRPDSFKEGEPVEEVCHLAQVSLAKIEKVTWLQTNRPAELR